MVDAWPYAAGGNERVGLRVCHSDFSWNSYLDHLQAGPHPAARATRSLRRGSDVERWRYSGCASDSGWAQQWVRTAGDAADRAAAAVWRFFGDCRLHAGDISFSTRTGLVRQPLVFTGRAVLVRVDLLASVLLLL